MATSYLWTNKQKIKKPSTLAPTRSIMRMMKYHRSAHKHFPRYINNCKWKIHVKTKLSSDCLTLKKWGDSAICRNSCLSKDGLENILFLDLGIKEKIQAANQNSKCWWEQPIRLYVRKLYQLGEQGQKPAIIDHHVPALSSVANRQLKSQVKQKLIVSQRTNLQDLQRKNWAWWDGDWEAKQWRCHCHNSTFSISKLSMHVGWVKRVCLNTEWKTCVCINYRPTQCYLSLHTYLRLRQHIVQW